MSASKSKSRSRSLNVKTPIRKVAGGAIYDAKDRPLIAQGDDGEELLFNFDALKSEARYGGNRAYVKLRGSAARKLLREHNKWYMDRAIEQGYEDTIIELSSKVRGVRRSPEAGKSASYSYIPKVPLKGTVNTHKLANGDLRETKINLGSTTLDRYLSELATNKKSFGRISEDIYLSLVAAGQKNAAKQYFTHVYDQKRAFFSKVYRPLTKRNISLGGRSYFIALLSGEPALEEAHVSRAKSTRSTSKRSRSTPSKKATKKRTSSKRAKSTTPKRTSSKKTYSPGGTSPGGTKYVLNPETNRRVKSTSRLGMQLLGTAPPKKSPVAKPRSPRAISPLKKRTVSRSRSTSPNRTPKPRSNSTKRSPGRVMEAVDLGEF